MPRKAIALTLGLVVAVLITTWSVLASSKPVDTFTSLMKGKDCQLVNVEPLEPRWVNYANVPLFMPQGRRFTYLCKDGAFVIREE